MLSKKTLSAFSNESYMQFYGQYLAEFAYNPKYKLL